jgi:hypothetical protein
VLIDPFFSAKRVGPARLGPLRAGLGQKIEPAGSAGPARFSAGRPVWPSLGRCRPDWSIDWFIDRSAEPTDIEVGPIGIDQIGTGNGRLAGSLIA